MSTIRKVKRATGHAYRAEIRPDEPGLERFSKTFKTKKAAETWAKRVEGNNDLCRAFGNPAARQKTLGDLISEYAEGKELGNISLLNWWMQEYGKHKICDITRPMVRDALKRLEAGEVHRADGRKGKTKSTGKPRTPATINRYKATLSTVFRYGMEQYDLPENPCRYVAGRTEGKGRIRFLSDDSTSPSGKTIDGERSRLLKACKASDWPLLHLLVWMAITTGARQGELLRLRWRDIKIKERQAYVGKTKNGEPRVLPLVESVVEALKLQRAAIIEEKREKLDPGVEELIPLGPETLIFESKREPGQPFEFRKHWDKAVSDAGIENFRFHDLRHSCASYLAQNGATLLEIADVLGHKTLEMVKRYSHLCIDHKAALIDRVMGNLKQ